MKYIFKSNYSNPRERAGTVGLTVAGLVVRARAGSVGSPRLHPAAAALTPLVVPHRVFPQLAHSSQLSKLPGRTFTVASPHIESPFFLGLSPGSKGSQASQGSQGRLIF